MNPKRLFTIVSIALLFLSIEAVQGQDLSGQWSGRWQSNANGHSGKIGATFCQISPHAMQTNFRGTFAKVIPFRYSTRLQIASQQPGLTVMAGNRRLPLGGQFKYHITMTDQCFHGTFSSKRNVGTFVMQRRP